MSRKPSFTNLRSAVPVTVPSVSPASSGTHEQGKAPVTAGRVMSREGRKQIAGFFTPEMSLALHMLARRQGRSLQALMAEAFNDVLRKHGESPMGE